MGAFADDVRVTPHGAGRYRAELDHGWDLVAVPQGGVVVALALRACATEVAAADHDLRTCTTVFAGQVAAGALEIDVTVLRAGRTATQVIATIRNEGAASGATVVAVYGTTRAGPTFVDVAPPAVPPPSACRSHRDAVPDGFAFTPMAFWDRVEGRAAMGHAPWEPYVPSCSDVATWLRFDDAPVLADGSVDPLGVVTLADRMPGAIEEKVGHGGPRWFAPSVDLTVQLLEPLRTEWVLAHDRARWADDGWASAESTLWDEAGTLVAYATQMMLFTYLPSA